MHKPPNESWIFWRWRVGGEWRRAYVVWCSTLELIELRQFADSGRDSQLVGLDNVEWELY